MTGSIPEFTVLGAGGFVGRHLVRHLEARGITCHAPARDAAGLCERPLGHAIYCIGLTADYLARPFDTVEAHVGLYARLLRNAEFRSMTYLSSTRLYDSGPGNGVESVDLPLNPLNRRHLYDFSKGLGEVLGVTCGRDNIRVARLACVYSDDLDGDNFLHDTLLRAVGAKRLVLDSNPAIARDYVHVEDVCAALVAIARGGKQPIYNVASGVNIRNDQLFALIEASTGCQIETTGAAPIAGAPEIDISALQRDFSITPRRIEDALPTLVSSEAAQAARQRTAS